jgi:PAS domain S-box-containing protein
MEYIRQVNTRTTQLFFAFGGIAVVVALFTAAGMRGSGLPAIFDLRPNAYAIVSAIAVLINLVFLFIATRLNIRGAEATWFVVFICAMTMYGLADCLTRLSATPEGAIFWLKFQGVSVLEPGAYFLFLLHYLNPRVKAMRTTALVIFTTIVVLFFWGNSNLLLNNNVADIKRYSWGYYNDVGSAFWIVILWVFFTSMCSLYLLLRYLRHTRYPILRRQAMLFLASALLPLMAGLITEQILPVIGINVVPMHVVFGSIGVGLILWGLERYRVFRISPALISEEILSMMSEAVVVVNANQEIEFANRQAQQLLLYSDDTIRRITDVMPAESAERIIHQLKQLDARQTVMIDDITIAQDTASVVRVRLSISRLSEENSIKGFLFVITDVTELKMSYEALQDKKASVEHLVQVRTKELRQAQNRLLEADKLKTEFVLLTAHNLQASLAHLKDNAQMIAEPGQERAAHEKLLHSLSRAADRLSDMIEGLLSVTTLDTGEAMTTSVVSADDMLADLVAETKELAAQTKTRFKPDLAIHDVQLKGNAHELGLALRTLLQNAFAFTPKGQVRLAARATDEQLIIKIADNGTGIPKAELAQLLASFHRAGTTDDGKNKGSGLQLTALIIKHHGGTITADSTTGPGHGTTFTIILPLNNTH